MADDHYFSPTPSAPSRPHEVELRLPDLTLSLVADSGVFSARAVDPGTLELLRRSPQPPASGHLLDLGCGYGAIACTLALRAPSATVWAVDVNERALSLTAANAERAGAANVRAVTADEIPSEVRFAGIWSNPPIRIGKEALHELLGTWLGRLDPEGSAWLVVHHHLGGDSLRRWLTGAGWATSKVASRKGYRVLRVSPR
jgi:16S rRNA (guanine1207-N2)-methyltransferase